MQRQIVTAVVVLSGFLLVSGHNWTADDEREVRAAIDSYVAAFNNGDLDSLVAHFATDADFIDDIGKQYKGKASLGDLLNRSLVELKDHKLRVEIISLRFLRPGVALVDGQAELSAPDGSVNSGRFTVVWTKIGNKWLLSCVRDLPASPARDGSSASPLNALEWLVGDWTHADPNVSVQVSGRWTLNKSFLVLEYIAQGEDGDDVTVIQYFGWDAVDGVIRSWFFDSKGGFGGGDWAREANTWTARWSGVVSEGWTASSVASMKYIDDKSFLFRSVDREIDGLPLADVEVKFTRKTAGGKGGAP
jgi:uncharacterized protein (TIGR02246 family)